MKLRFFSAYNEHGYDFISNELQYWDEDQEQWMPVNHVRVRGNRVEESLGNPDEY